MTFGSAASNASTESLLLILRLRVLLLFSYCYGLTEIFQNALQTEIHVSLECKSHDCVIFLHDSVPQVQCLYLN